jgi:hypothetical protein
MTGFAPFCRLLPIFLMFSAVCAFTGSAYAQDPPLCSEKSAFGQTFGTDKVVGKITYRFLNSVYVLPPESWPPFTEFEVGVSRKSKRVFSSLASAKFADEQAAKEFAEQIAQRIRAELPVKDTETENSGAVLLYTGSAGREVESAYVKRSFVHTDGLKVRIRQQDRSVSVDCIDLVLRAKHINEVMGE